MGEITIDEIIYRGIKLPDDCLSFPIEKFEDYGDDLRYVGGVYTFTHETEGWLYVGISRVLHNRITNHLNGNGGNERLSKKLKQMKNITITIYREKNSSLRELYENVLILKYNPKLNTRKKSATMEGSDFSVDSEVISEIFSLSQNGLKYSEIEKLTGVDRRKIGSILRQSGKPRPISNSRLNSEQLKDRNDIIVDLSKNNMTYQQIASSLGLSVSCVSKVLTGHRRKMNLIQQSDAYRKERNAEIIKLYSQGITQKDIAKKLMISQSSVSIVVRKNKEGEQ